MHTDTIAQNQLKLMGAVRDKLQRPLHDLRISVIDQCNFRCTYCMPTGSLPNSFPFTKREEWLTFDEIVTIVKQFIPLGVEKIRLTGGEPLLRPNLIELIERLSKIERINDIALTTNGSLLKQNAKSLRSAGLKRLTVSMNSLDEKIFHQMNGGLSSTHHILEGISAAQNAGFRKIKINVVVQKGVNDHKIMDVVEYFRNTDHILRFIEYMDVGTCNHWNNLQVVPSAVIIKRINKTYPLNPVTANYFGEVSKRHLYADGRGEIGFVSSISQPFCHSCTRARLSSNGKLYTCLFSNNGHNLKKALQGSNPDKAIADVLKDIWHNREARYSELRQSLHLNQEYTNRVEMFQIGG